jgi:hypothetical protein
MPTNKRRIPHEFSPDIPLVALHFLTDGLVPLPEDSGDQAAEWKQSKDKWEAALEQYSVEIIKLWVEERPGTRPSWWWQRHAPEPCRKRLSGIGDPAFEHLSYVPHYDHGIPATFVSEWDVAYYNGRSRDVHGQRNSPYKEGDFKGVAINPKDPPRYESEASYLKRHGLLTPTEQRRLKPKDFKPELVEN